MLRHGRCFLVIENTPFNVMEAENGKKAVQVSENGGFSKLYSVLGGGCRVAVGDFQRVLLEKGQEGPGPEYAREKTRHVDGVESQLAWKISKNNRG